MANVLLPHLPGTWPQGYCPATYQELLNTVASNTQTVLENGMAYYNYGDTKPAPEFQGYPWLRQQDMRWYWFSGNWISPTNLNPDERRLWVGTLANLVTYDGGDVSGNDTDRSGSVWIVDTDFDGRTLVAPGTIPDTAPARTISVGVNTDSLGGAGAWMRTLLRANLPDERLFVFTDEVKGEPVVDVTALVSPPKYSNPDSEAQSYRMGSGTGEPTVGRTNALGSGTPFVQSPPFRGIYVIKPRPNRTYYSAP